MRPLIHAGSIRNRGEFVPVQDYTPAWTATAGVAPAIGNGSLTGKVEVRGKWRLVSIQLVGGSTTTWGTAGIWNFSVPVNATRSATAPVYIEDSGTGFYIGQAFIAAGTNVVFIVMGGGASTRATFNAPMTWAVNDNLAIDLEYLA